MKELRSKTIAALTKQVELLEKGGASSAEAQESVAAISALTNSLKALHEF